MYPPGMQVDSLIRSCEKEKKWGGYVDVNGIRVRYEHAKIWFSRRKGVLRAV
jgi:hypothetical protein